MVVDYTYIVLGIQLISGLIGGTIIDTFSQMRATDADRERQMVQRCFVCGIERVVLGIEHEGYEVHTLYNHNLWNYVFFLTYLKQKHPAELTSLELYFFKSVQLKNQHCLPFQNSVFLCQRPKAAPPKPASQTIEQEISKLREDFELLFL